MSGGPSWDPRPRLVIGVVCADMHQESRRWRWLATPGNTAGEVFAALTPVFGPKDPGCG